MKLWEVIKNLQEGKKITNKSWDKGAYIYMRNQKVYNQSHNSVDEVIYTPLEWLFRAPEDDWLILKEWEIVGGDCEAIIEECPHCGRRHYRMVDETTYIYCPHCGKQVVK